MREIKITDLKPGMVNDVEVLLPNNNSVYEERYFEWNESTLISSFKSSDISGGILNCWKHQPLFVEAETHIDNEIFYFISGTAIMLFVDYNDGKPNMETIQITRIQPGTQIIISKNKGHFVPVAEGDCPVKIIVVSPKMEAPRKGLIEPVLGVE